MWHKRLIQRDESRSRWRCCHVWMRHLTGSAAATCMSRLGVNPVTTSGWTSQHTEEAGASNATRSGLCVTLGNICHAVYLNSNPRKTRIFTWISDWFIWSLGSRRTSQLASTHNEIPSGSSNLLDQSVKTETTQTKVAFLASCFKTATTFCKFFNKGTLSSCDDASLHFCLQSSFVLVQENWWEFCRTKYLPTTSRTKFIFS